MLEIGNTMLEIIEKIPMWLSDFGIWMIRNPWISALIIVGTATITGLIIANTKR